jgi:hypothetical protein
VWRRQVADCHAARWSKGQWGFGRAADGVPKPSLKFLLLIQFFTHPTHFVYQGLCRALIAERYVTSFGVTWWEK